MNVYKVKYYTIPTDEAVRKKYCQGQYLVDHVAYIEANNISELDSILKDYHRKPVDEIYYSHTITAIELKKVILIKNKE